VLVGSFVEARSARADGGEGTSLFPATGAWRGGGEMETSAFRVDGRRGSYASAIGRFEWAPINELGLRARVPVYSLALEGEGGTRDGLGDVELRLRLQLLRRDPLRITGGWVNQLPTGARHAGLGEGALQMTPFVSVGYKVDRTVFYLTLADTVSVAGPHQQRFSNYVDPGTDHELRTTLGAIYSITDLVSASLVVTNTTILTSVDRGRSLMTGAMQLGTQPDRRLRLILAQQLPLAGEERFSWKLNAAATFAF
jgi:hypothetical protein